MKKSIVAVIVLLAIIAALPLIGNTLLKEKIEQRVLQLQSVGLAVQAESSDSTYLHTSRHFEFILQDAQLFLKYLGEYSQQQIPPYIENLLDGTLVGVDISYLNFPFVKAVEIEIYPLALSQSNSDSLKMNDIKLYTEIEEFLHNKGILYHIDYNFLNSKFKGFIKDIDEKYTLKDKTQIELELTKFTFSGKGDLIAPERVKSRVKNIFLRITDDREKINFLCRNFSSSSNFDSATTYITNMQAQKLDIIMDSALEDINMSLRDIRMNASSNTQNKSLELQSKISFKEFALKSTKLNIAMQRFNIDMALSQLDKEKFESLRLLVSDDIGLKQPATMAEIERSFRALLTEGMMLNIADLSLKNIDIDDAEDLGGFEIKSDITLQKDSALSSKMQISPLLLISDIEVHTKSSVSKKLLTHFVTNPLIQAKFQEYAKERAKEYLFEIDFVDSHLTINGKRVN